MLSMMVAMTVLVAAVSAQGLTASQSGLRVANCKLGATSLSQCDTTGYAIRIAVFSGPGLIIAVLFLLAAPMYLIGKYCCNCCGGRRQAPNFCCPADELSAVYSKGDLIRPRVVLFLALATAIGAFIWGYVGGGNLESGIVTIGDRIADVPTLLRAELNSMDAALTVSLYTASSDSTSTVALLHQASFSNVLTAGNASLNSMTSLVGDNVGQVQKYVKDYSFIVWVFFAVPVGLLVVGAFFSVCSIRRYGPMVLVWLSFLLGTLVWICHAVFCLSSMVVADGCVEIHGVAYEQQNVLPALVGCTESMFADFTTNFNSMRTTLTQDLCNQLTPYCYDSTKTTAQNAAAGTVLVCPSPMDCTSVTFGQMTVWMATAFQTSHDIAFLNPTSSGTDGLRCATAANLDSCYLNICQTDCTYAAGGLSSYGKLSKQFWSSYQALRNVSNVIDTQASQYSNCDSLFSLLISPLDAPCKTVTNALIADRQASGLLGLCMIAALFSIAWGAKRNLPLSEEGKSHA